MAGRTLGAIHIRWFRWYFAWRRGDFYLSQSELYHHQQYDGSDQSGNCHGPPSKCATSKLRIGSRARPRRRRTRISFHSPYWAIQRSWLCVPQWGFQQLCAGQFRTQIRLLSNNTSSKLTGGAPLCSVRSFVYRSNFTDNRNKLLLSDQVLHCLQRTLEVDHPGFAAAIQSSQNYHRQDYLERVYVECLNC